MSRTWISVPIGHGIRIGRSFGAEDRGPPKLPKWRRFELVKALQAGAVARGKPIAKDEAEYLIDKSLAAGLLDSNGDLNFVVKGESRVQCVQQIQAIAETWGQPLSLGAAERKFDDAWAKGPPWKWWQWFAIGMLIGLILLLAVACIVTPAAARCHRCPPPHQSWFYAYPGGQVRQQDVFRYGPPELGGYRYGGRGPDGKYQDVTTYRD
jgi:hypothetical protein